MLKVNEYGGRQAKGNEKRQCFKGWETLVTKYSKKINMRPRKKLDFKTPQDCFYELIK